MGVPGILNALARGAEVVWDPPERPRIRATGAVAAFLREDMEGTREVLRRAVAFRGQLKEHSPVPLFVLPEGKNADTGCISCGEETPGEQIRCPLCQAAAWIALGIVPLNSGEL